MGWNDPMNPVMVDEIRAELKTKAQAAPAGRAARKLAGGPDTTMTQTLVVLCAGAELAEHENPGEATVLILEGSLDVGFGGQTLSGSAGMLMIVPAQKHNVIATVDTVFLITSVKLRR